MMPARTVEHRTEPRTICSGEVRFLDDGPPPSECVGELVDISEHGFRAIHHTQLACGTQVRFRHRFFVGRAQVMWTRPTVTQVESGFRIVRD